MENSNNTISKNHLLKVLMVSGLLGSGYMEETMHVIGHSLE